MAHASADALEGDGHRPLMDAFWMSGLYFTFGTAIHTIDHLRRGQGSVTDELFVAGNLALTVQIVAITLILTRHRAAPMLAVATGVPLALAFIASHWLPRWSSISDSFVDDGAGAFSWLASAAEVTGALAIGIIGWLVFRLPATVVARR